ncbi:MAG: hypothetical protein A2381_12850 [Bdellovibrionales bacterium RIFOXYB1_FULL_37_110]|nr:MAG: hypothetical protein A2181_02175 [Bdellovibrionales bacterium RIFOXYA1_FULL_38_20]OFZ51595.1 MAG: hypothetical protein A2417_12510 [Bdellovibrionales bacterium RIFOXYC1_FULL_37_79]OFZ60422.1 MAG: hypothetical protein A2381_12850 [Bdellovibrionales bacterium RIFOXYB1_FULL_37_110]OFZ64995.1 MAG: hypothetical protein A2577_09115 [Bdellovibrionales bacterium RIFOXYD1_FULL_36_51]
MTDLSYLELGRKMSRPAGGVRPTKASFLANNKINYSEFTDKDIVEGYCDDLLKLLGEEDLRVMISGIFRIQNQLSELLEEKNMDHSLSLDDFFRQLSPLLLEVLWETANQEVDQSQLLKKFQEAIRISLEEELYLWQDRH